MDLPLLIRLTVALAVGTVIGLERGWANRDESRSSGDSGLRNFALSGLLGGVAAVLAGRWTDAVLVATLLGLAGLSATAYVLTARRTGDYGTTTEIALFTCFLLGALSVSGLPQEAMALAVVTAWILGAKPELKRTLRWLQRHELLATLQLLLIAVVILPLLPDEAMGPWQAVRPRTIGWLVLLVSGISYVGYFANRTLGGRVGLLLTAVFGGLASSTASTLSFSRLAHRRENSPATDAALALAIVVANSVMAPRLLLVIRVVNGPLAARLLGPLLLMAAVPVSLLLLRAWQGGPPPDPRPRSQAGLSIPTLRNPVALGAALQVAALLALLSILVRWAEVRHGTEGILGLAALSGLLDVDAVSLSLARAALEDLSMGVAAVGTLIAVTANTLLKVVLIALVGSPALARRCAPPLAAGLLAAGLLLWGLG